MHFHDQNWWHGFHFANSASDIFILLGVDTSSYCSTHSTKPSSNYVKACDNTNVIFPKTHFEIVTFLGMICLKQEKGISTIHIYAGHALDHAACISTIHIYAGHALDHCCIYQWPGAIGYSGDWKVKFVYFQISKSFKDQKTSFKITHKISRNLSTFA